MARRHTALADGEVYHVYNRSIGKEDIFSKPGHVPHFSEIIDYYRFPQNIKYSRFCQLPSIIKESHWKTYHLREPMIELFVYAIMPNHYHFLIRQQASRGIQTFISLLQNSFAKYYNLKQDRPGSLFQHQFKAKHIETEEELLHVSRYIHLNPVTSMIIPLEELDSHPWTSLPAYLGKKKVPFLSLALLNEHFRSPESHAAFIFNQVEYQHTLHRIKHLLMD